MAFEVVVRGEDARPDELLLEGADIVQKVFGLAAADVIDGVGGIGQAVPAGALLRSALHDAVNTFDDIVDIGEVAAHVAVIDNPDRLAGHKPPGGTVIEHVGYSRRTVDSEESEACGGNVVELGIGVSQQFIAPFGRRIEADRVVHLVIGAEGYLHVAAIDG